MIFKLSPTKRRARKLKKNFSIPVCSGGLRVMHSEKVVFVENLDRDIGESCRAIRTCWWFIGMYFSVGLFRSMHSPVPPVHSSWSCSRIRKSLWARRTPSRTARPRRLLLKRNKARHDLWFSDRDNIIYVLRAFYIFRNERDTYIFFAHTILKQYIAEYH